MNFKKITSPISIRNDVREGLLKRFSQYLTKDMCVYDIGCGDKPFASFLQGKVKEHVGVDIEDGFYSSNHIDLVGTAYHVPIEDCAADAVISSQVIEHLDDPIKALKEINRIVAPGGILFLSFPFLYPIHAEPHDYARYTEYFMEKKLKEYDFEVLEIDPIGGFWYCAGSFFAMYIQSFDRGILSRLKIVKALIWLIKAIFLVFHKLEGYTLKLAGKDVPKIRSLWTTNYTYVARKKSSNG